MRRKGINDVLGVAINTAGLSIYDCLQRFLYHQELESVMKLYMIRHGETEANVDYTVMAKKCDKQVELTGKGFYDALGAGLRLKKIFKMHGYKRALFICSTWKRARQTWRVINSTFHEPNRVLMSNKVTEHFCNLADHPANWAKFEAYKEDGWPMLPYWYTVFEGGETLDDTYSRAESFIDDVRTKYREYDAVVVVSHGQFIKMCKHVAEQMEMDEIDKISHPMNGDIVELDV